MKASNKIIVFWKKYNLFIKFTVAFILLFLLFKNIDLKESLILTQKINLMISIPIFLYVPALIISTIKWKYVLKTKRTFWVLFNIYWISNFFSNFLPSSIGGDSYKVLKLKKELGTKKVLESVIFDRLSGFLIIITFSVIFSYWAYKLFNNFYFLLIPTTTFTILIFLSIVFHLDIKSRYFAYLKNLFFRFKSKLIFLLSLSLIFFLMGALSLWTYFFMFGYNINFFLIVAFYSIIQLLSMIPISINSLGISEGSIVYLFLMAGVPAEVSLSIAIISRIIMVFQTSIGGLIYIFKK